MVADQIVDSRPEAAYDPEQKQQRARTGPPMWQRMHESLTTTIGYPRAGKPALDSDAALKVYSLRKWQVRSRIADTSERTLASGLREITILAGKLSLSKNVIDTAANNFRKAIKNRLIRGRSILTITAASLYLACRKCGVPRSLDEIAEHSLVSRKDLGRSFRFLLRELELSVPVPANRTFAAMFSNRLNLSGKTETIAIQILDVARKRGLTNGRGPAGVAAAATYVATILTNERKTQKDIAKMADVTEVTIRNRYKEIASKLIVEVQL